MMVANQWSLRATDNNREWQIETLGMIVKELIQGHWWLTSTVHLSMEWTVVYL